tara:strand:- start:783 stop:1391 length:609 start_codon:yes stop_codon:yes gene_type:complete
MNYFDNDCANAMIIPTKTKKIMQGIIKEPKVSRSDTKKRFDQAIICILTYAILQFIIYIFIICYFHGSFTVPFLNLLDKPKEQSFNLLYSITGLIIFICILEELDLSIHKFLPNQMSDSLLMILGWIITTLLFLCLTSIIIQLTPSYFKLFLNVFFLLFIVTWGYAVYEFTLYIKRKEFYILKKDGHITERQKDKKIKEVTI